MRYVVVDIETSGLDPHVHEPIEVGMVSSDGTECAFSLPFDLSRADEVALDINGYHKRQFAPLLDHQEAIHNVMGQWFQHPDTMFVASPAHFDEGFLAAWIRRQNARPPWGHRNVIDVKTYAQGKWGTVAPLKNDMIATVLGIPLLQSNEAHDALNDARWTAQIFQELIK